MRIRKHRTTILIDNDHPPNDDWKWLQSKGLKPTSILRKRIREMKETEVYGNVDYKAANQKLHEKITNLCEALEQILDKKQFDAVMQKI